MTPEEVVKAVMSQSATMTRPIYRGQADSDWPPESGAIRRLRDAYGEDLPDDESELRTLVAKYHTDQLIIPMQVINGADLSDLQRLSVLQHQGAATGLLDFTEYLLAALWFACKEHKELDDKDARILILDIGNPQVAQNSRTLTSDPFSARQITVYYEPDRSLGARIIAQRSVFIICNPLIPDQHLKSVVVPKESKEPLRNYLTQLGLSQAALFGDIPGLAAANTVQTLLRHTGALTPEQYRDRGNLAYQAGRYDDALAAYESYAEMLPNIAQPHCLKGDVLAVLGQFEDAGLAYTTAIDNLDRPIYLGESVVVNHELIGNSMRRALHYNRGNVRAAAGNHSQAVEDFDLALQYGHVPKRGVLKNRGNSKFVMHMFVEAYQDFEAANMEQPGSDAALAMGNCKVRIGEFEDALQQYLAGANTEPRGSALHCQGNAEQVRRILKTLDGHDFQVRNEGVTVFIETAHIQRSFHSFPIAGNQGNTGNTPSGMVTAHGGEGYEGLDGFAVVILPTTS